MPIPQHRKDQNCYALLASAILFCTLSNNYLGNSCYCIASMLLPELYLSNFQVKYNDILSTLKIITKGKKFPWVKVNLNTMTRTKQLESAIIKEVPRQINDSEILYFLHNKDINWQYVNAIKS